MIYHSFVVKMKINVQNMKSHWTTDHDPALETWVQESAQRNLRKAHAAWALILIP